MTYQEYTTHMKVCGYMGTPPKGRFKKIHDFLTGLWDGLEIVLERKTGRFTFQKDRQWYFVHDHKNGYLLCDGLVWSFFLNDMRMKDNQTQEFIRMVVEEHLNCQVGSFPGLRGVYMPIVEEQFRGLVGTPYPTGPFIKMGP